MGPYASHAYLSINNTEIFTFQLDYGCSDGTHFDIYYNNKWSSIKNMFELTNNNVKELFLLAAEHTITNLNGYSGRSDKALTDLKTLLEN
jgi:hypothetical protein